MEILETNLLHPQTNGPKKTWRFVWLFLLIIGILTVLVWTSASVFGRSTNNIDSGDNNSKHGFFTQIKNLLISPDRQLKGEKEDRVNILLLGIGGEGHDGPYLTDTIILASIQPSTGQIALLSIPRDLLVTVPGYGLRKINNADAFGETQRVGYGPVLAADVVQTVFGLPVHYYLRADFQAFKEVVDELGGVTVNVDNAFTDNNYPTYDHLVQTISFEAGWQKMDGETALRFSRSRHGANGEGSDFARSRRQQKVIMAVKNKVFSSSFLMNLGRVQDIFESLNKNITTNMELWEISQFYKLAKKLDYENITTRVLEAGINKPLMEAYYDGASVLQPRGDSFEELARIAQNIFTDKPLETATAAATPAKISGPRVEVQNGTWVLGLAARTKMLLEEKNVTVTEVSNARTRNYQKTTVYDFSRGRYQSKTNAIKKILNAEIIVHPNAGLFSSSTPDILIIVGAASSTN